MQRGKDKTYLVTCTETVTYEVPVQAVDKDDALDVARLMLLGDDARPGVLMTKWPKGLTPTLSVEDRSWDVTEGEPGANGPANRQDVETFLDRDENDFA